MPHADPEIAKAYFAARYQAKRADIAEKARVRYMATREIVLERQRQPEARKREAELRRARPKKPLTEERKAWMRAHMKATYQDPAIRAVRLAKAKTWRLENRDKCNAVDVRRKAAKLNATPLWLTDAQHAAIATWYERGAAAGMEVDHIVPLRGKTVCGLHVPWNMQLLTRTENSAKGNRLQEAA